MAYPCTRPRVSQHRCLHRRSLGALVRAGIPARPEPGGHATRGPPSGSGARGRWRDAELAASAFAADLFRGDTARTRYAAGSSTGRARVELRRGSHHPAARLLLFRAARRGGRCLPSEKRTSERSVERHDCRRARPLPEPRYGALSRISFSAALSASSAGTLTSGTTPTPSQFVPVMGLIEFPHGTLIAKCSPKRPSDAGCPPPPVVSPTMVARFRACRSYANASAAENVCADVST